MSPSVHQHGSNGLEKSGAAPPVVITMPDDEIHVGDDDKITKGARLNKYAKGLNYFRIAKYLFFLLAMVGIIVLALQVSKGKSRCETLKLIDLDADPHNSSRPGRDPETQSRDAHSAPCPR